MQHTTVRVCVCMCVCVCVCVYGWFLMCLTVGVIMICVRGLHVYIVPALAGFGVHGDAAPALMVQDALVEPPPSV